FATTLDAQGCAFGYCVPGAAGANAEVGWSTGGTQVGISTFDADDPEGSGGIVVFDAATQQPLRTVPFYGDDYGLSNSFSSFAFVGDVLLVRGDDAGPYSGVWAF